MWMRACVRVCVSVCRIPAPHLLGGEAEQDEADDGRNHNGGDHTTGDGGLGTLRETVFGRALNKGALERGDGGVVLALGGVALVVDLRAIGN